MPTFPTPAPVTATLTTAGALVRVTASERTDTVVLVEPVDATSASDMKVAAKTKVGFSAGALTVETVKAGGRHGSVVIAVEVPVGSRLVLNTAWSDVHAEGPLGDCVLDVASGTVRLDRIGALRASLAAGEVAIGHVAGAVDIEGGSAGIGIDEVDGVVKYVGATGKVRIGHARSAVGFGGAQGAFEIGTAEGDVVATAGDCPIRIGRLTRGRAELLNASGGIEVGIAEGVTARVDAASTKGSVRDSLPTHAGPADVEVYARTRKNDIVVHRADA
ncbi:hypothetical protein GCM10022243_53640 [Saccharothrix violaceirubra]|uniref:Adhesin n=1 Tax=Saccharothrix violaceirubra TaxID=413306 RepID=A0A7W7SYR8_9PSEU|nr:hypothetical protein [Saccharothrix violaceirubra]MBB4963427.1 hypothetical protein [Saccharothrix violaceirubra]